LKNKEMNYKIRSVICFLALFFSFMITPSGGQAQGFLKAEGKRIVNQQGEAVLLRGMGLGGWMLQEGYMLGIQNEGQQYKIKERIKDLIGTKETKDFYKAWLNKFTTRKDIEAMKAWGFNSVRLPMHYNLYTLPIEEEPVSGKDTWLDEGFAMTDSLLAWCRENKMYLILDLHAAPGGQGNDLNIADRNPALPSLWESPENQRKTVALWRKLAAKYVNEPWIAAYDVINEPNWGFEDLANDKNGLKEQKNKPLRDLLVKITQAIREVDKRHMVIIEGNGWGNNYNGMFPLWDDNMVLSFHKYWNNNDQESIKGILEQREKHNVPVWLGETGENSNVWFTEAISLLERNDIGWCWWPLKKVGFNNPLEIQSNADYDQVVKYWNKKGVRPSKAIAYRGLTALKNNLSFERNIKHPDVIDAMFRQVGSVKTIPFKSFRLKNAGKLQIAAVDYDLGRNGYAYFDKDTADYRISTGKNSTGNRGRVYRNDGVDIRRTETGDGFYVSDIEDGEWLQYTIEVETSGKYSIQLEVSPEDTGKVSITLDHVAVGSPMPIQKVGSKKWQFTENQYIHLEKGPHQLRVHADQGGFNLKTIIFTPIK
jgi:endoglucanase